LLNREWSKDSNFADRGNFDGPKNGYFDGNFEEISIAEKNEKIDGN